MTISKEVEDGQAVYSKLVLSIYDLWVLGISNRYIWHCPTPRLLQHYNQNISSNHLDIGVGTGYYLDKCQFPSHHPRVVLFDLNQNSLDKTKQRIARYNPIVHQLNILDNIEIEMTSFDSIALNYLFHCLPHNLSKKLVVLDHIHPLLAENGTIFGATILSKGKGIEKSRTASKLMKIYNKKGIFGNSEDHLDDLVDYLSNKYTHYQIDIQGCVAIFKAVK